MTILTQEKEQLGKLIVNAAYLVHKNLGPGLLENIYEICFCHELGKAGLKVKRQTVLPLVYDNIVFEHALKLDVLVNDLIICELKAVETMHPVFAAQILSYLKLAHKRLGYLINFNVPLIRDGIKRMIIKS